MKILTMTLSFVLALALAFGPFAALVEARGGGSGGSGGAAGGGGAGAGAAGAGAAGAAAGGGGTGPGASGSSSSGSPSTSGSPSASPAASGFSSRPAASPRMMYPAAAVPGRQTVTGEVTQIDNAKGTFSLRTADAGTLDLQAAPSAVSGVKRGDVVVVEIIAKPAP